MPKSFTRYNVSWKSQYPFLKRGPTEYEAHCVDCDYTFPIKNGGKNDIKRHIKRKSHNKDLTDNSSDVVDCAENQVDGNNNEANVSEILSPQEEVIRAETIEALKVVNSNYSFFFKYNR